MSEICGKCGSVDSRWNKTEGGRSTGLFIILLLFAIVPGLLYWGFAKKERKYSVCNGCGAENEFYSLDTPKGKQLLEQYHTDKNGVPTYQPEVKKLRFPRFFVCQRVDFMLPVFSDAAR